LIYKTEKLKATNAFGTTFDYVHYTYPTCLTYCTAMRNCCRWWMGKLYR